MGVCWRCLVEAYLGVFIVFLGFFCYFIDRLMVVFGFVSFLVVYFICRRFYDEASAFLFSACCFMSGLQFFNYLVSPSLLGLCGLFRVVFLLMGAFFLLLSYGFLLPACEQKKCGKKIVEVK